MKRTIGPRNEITLTVRTEDGRVSVDIGIDDLSKIERKFLFRTVQGVLKGGTVEFGAKENVQGAVDLTLRLKEPSVETAVKAVLQ